MCRSHFYWYFKCKNTASHLLVILWNFNIDWVNLNWGHPLSDVLKPHISCLYPPPNRPHLTNSLHPRTFQRPLDHLPLMCKSPPMTSSHYGSVTLNLNCQFTGFLGACSLMRAVPLPYKTISILWLPNTLSPLRSTWLLLCNHFQKLHSQ